MYLGDTCPYRIASMEHCIQICAFPLDYRSCNILKCLTKNYWRGFQPLQHCLFFMNKGPVSFNNGDRVGVNAGFAQLQRKLMLIIEKFFLIHYSNRFKLDMFYFIISFSDHLWFWCWDVYKYLLCIVFLASVIHDRILRMSNDLCLKKKTINSHLC